MVILGGGFAGVYAAQRLEKLLGRKDDFDITLINRENYFVFQPMLPEVISGSIGVMDMVSPIRHLLPRTRLHVREVEQVDLANRLITTTPGIHPRAHVVPFDHLIVALGTVTDFRGMRGLPEHALPFKDLGDALRVRNHVIRALEEAAIEQDDASLRRELLTFVVAGGGFSGVEVAAELNDFVRHVARNFGGLRPEEIRVVLVHSQDRILPEMTESLARFAMRILRDRGVELILNARLAAATGEMAVLNDGRTIPTHTLISTIPSSPHPMVEALDLPKVKGRLQVGADLRVSGTPNVWALGDCASVPAPDAAACPPTAQHATRQAAVVADNVVAAIRGGTPRTFSFRGLGQMGSLGRRSAVAQIMGFKISGFVAWFLWRTIYLMKLPGWGRRLKVAAAWTFDLILPPELVQLRLHERKNMVREHFEPGEEVFRQGDLGDRIYLIIGGAAEVSIHRDGKDLVVGTLGKGEYFGEMALLDHTTRSATVRCTAPMDALVLNKVEFGQLVDHLPELRSTFERVKKARVEKDRVALSPAAEPPTGS